MAKNKRKLDVEFLDAAGRKTSFKIEDKKGTLEVSFKGTAADGTDIDLKMKLPGGGADAAAFLGAEQIFYAPLSDLNGRGIEGAALMALNDGALTVITLAEGVDAGLHVQHIHGFGGEREAITPTLADDADGDGFIELGEGFPKYGPIQIALDPAPMPTGDAFVFVNTFDLSDTLVTGANLTAHEVVLHGADIAPGPGAGTDGEVNGTNGYLAVLPIGAGEIEAVDPATADFEKKIETGDLKLEIERKDGDAEIKFSGRDANGEKLKFTLEEKDGAVEFKFKGSDSDGDKVDIKVSLEGADIDPFLTADSLFYAVLDDLNGLGVEGAAILALNGGRLTVLTAAEGVDPGLHVQHIHGFGGERDAVTPSLADDADGDGFVELGEGFPNYGPIQISLDPAPMPTGDAFLFIQSFDLEGTVVTPDNLTQHEVVLHGADIAPGPGAGTDGEVNGTNGYLAVLPIGAGEIEMIDFA